MAEFTSLNGYQVKDTVARSIAKGRNQAVAFVDYETMIEALNEYEKDEYKAGQNVYIGVVGVPDLWVYSVEDIRHTFIYESDDDIVDKLKNNTTVQVGFFKLAMLEGQKVDLTTHDQHLAKHDDDIAGLSDDVAGINDSLTAENSQTFQFAYDSESGKYGYKVKEADTDVFVPFRTNDFEVYHYACDSASRTTKTVTVSNIPSGEYIVLAETFIGYSTAIGHNVVQSVSITDGTLTAITNSSSSGNYGFYKLTVNSTSNLSCVLNGGTGSGDYANYCIRIIKIKN